MRKELIHELVVAAPADAVWAVYSSPDLPKIIVELLPSAFEKIEIVEGDGGVGTVLHLVFPPGSVPLTYKEKFVTIDHEKRLKEVLQIEGGYLDLGCTFYMDSFHILEKDYNSCIIKSITAYEVRDDVVDNVSSLISIDSLAGMAEAISKFVLKKQKDATKSHHNHGHHGDHDHGQRDDKNRTGYCCPFNCFG